MKIIFQLSILFTLVSCGVFKTRKEFISIDSTPRGLEVYRQEEGKEAINKVGTTPMFLEVPKGAEDIYLMKDPEIGKRSINTTPKRICRYQREGETFSHIDNVKAEKFIKKFVNSWSPENLFKGTSFECMTIVRAEIKNAPLPKKEKICHSYLIMPPKSSFVKVSSDLAKAWIEQVFNKSKSNCDKTITPGVSEDYMLFLGIDEATSPADINEIDYQKLLKIAAKFKATDVVFLPFEEKDKTFSVTPKIYDIHAAKIRKNAPNDKYKKVLDVSGGYKISNAILSTFRIIPNGVAFQQRFRNRFHGTGDNEELFDKNYANYIPYLSVNNLVFPQYRWKGETMVVPHVVWETWGDSDPFKMDLYGLMMDIKFFWHLPPGGVVTFRAGFGGTYIFAKSDKYNYTQKSGAWMANAGVEYYFFPWERIYLLAGYRRYFIPPVITGPNFAIKGESDIFLNIGYFFPEFRTAVRRWLNF